MRTLSSIFMHVRRRVHDYRFTMCWACTHQTCHGFDIDFFDHAIDLGLIRSHDACFRLYAHSAWHFALAPKSFWSEHSCPLSGFSMLPIRYKNTYGMRVIHPFLVFMVFGFDFFCLMPPVWCSSAHWIEGVMKSLLCSWWRTLWFYNRVSNTKWGFTRLIWYQEPFTTGDFTLLWRHCFTCMQVVSYMHAGLPVGIINRIRDFNLMLLRGSSLPFPKVHLDS